MYESLHDRVQGLSEVVMGGMLMTIGYWGPIFDEIARGLHFVAAVCGAIIGIHGVVRLFRHGRRRFPR